MSNAIERLRSTAKRRGLGVFVVMALQLVLGGCNLLIDDPHPKPVDEVDREWADWPMPNPPGLNLPNPAIYSLDAENGVVTDTITGLNWQRTLPKDPQKTQFTWEEAKTYCSNLSFGGCDDWRLPTAIELTSLVDFTKSDPEPTIDANMFPNTPPTDFWTSSLSTAYPTAAWVVYFYDGFAGTRWSTNSNHVRCVRNAPAEAPVGRLTTNEETAFDTKTLLTWQRGTAPMPFTWEEAKQFCKDLDPNRNDWRLPTVKELQTIVDRRRNDPAFDATIFSEIPSDWFWSSTPHAAAPTVALAIEFGEGTTFFKKMDETHNVRCVR